MLFFGWVDQLGSSRLDSGVDIAVDTGGNIFIAGDTEGNLEGTNQGNSDIWFARYEQVSENDEPAIEREVWRAQIGTRQIDRTTGIAAVNGDIYLTGYTFGDLAGTNSNQGGSDIWLARYTTNDQNEAQEVWRLQPNELNNENEDVATDIFVAADGTIYLTGTRTAQGLSNVWFAKYTANGDNAPVIDGSRKTISSGGNDVVYGITADDEGNIYLAGATDGVLGQKNQGSIDAWVAKYDGNGNPLWLRQLGSEGREEAKRIAVDNDGNVYVTGYTSGTLGGNSLGQWDAWLAKLDSNGNFNQDNVATGYIVQFGTSSNDDAFDLAIGNEGQIVVAGRTLGDIGTEDNDIDRSFDDIWLAEFIADSGENVTIRQYGSNSVDIAQGIAINGDDVFVAGTTYGTLTTNQDNAGLSDAFLLKYTFTEPEGGELVEEPVDVTLGEPEVFFQKSLYKGSPGEIIKIPVRIDDANGVRSVDFTIDFDDDILDFIGVTPGPIILNSTLGGSSELLSTWKVTDNSLGEGQLTTPGLLQINTFNDIDDTPPDVPDDGGEPLVEGEEDLKGELVTLEFQILETADPNKDDNELEFTEILVNEKNLPKPRIAEIDVIPDYLAVEGEPVVFGNGFEIQFSRSINTDVLNLYTNQLDDIPDLILLDPNGEEVQGSLFWNQVTNTLTFLKYKDILDNSDRQVLNPGTYTLTLDGERTEGIVTPLGTLLDGDSDGEPGGDFVTTFEVPVYDKFFSIQDISRGPEQVLEFPSAEADEPATPMSISINSIQGVTKLEFSLIYDSDILDSNTIDVIIDSSLQQNGWSLNRAKSDGEIDITLQGPSLSSVGVRNLVSLNAQVRPDAPYNSSQILQISGMGNNDILINDGAFNGEIGVDNGVHLVNYVGDATGGKVYESGDTSLISRVAVELDSGFISYPLIAPEILGDVTGDGRVTAFDAAIVAREGVGIVNEPLLPDLPLIEIV